MRTKTDLGTVHNAEELFKLLEVMGETLRRRTICTESDFWRVVLSEYENGALTMSIKTGDYE